MIQITKPGGRKAPGGLRRTLCACYTFYMTNFFPCDSDHHDDSDPQTTDANADPEGRIILCDECMAEYQAGQAEDDANDEA